MFLLVLVKKLQPIKRDENVSLRPSTAPMKGGSGKKQQQQQQQLTQPPLDKVGPQNNSKVCCLTKANINAEYRIMHNLFLGATNHSN